MLIVDRIINARLPEQEGSFDIEIDNGRITNVTNAQATNKLKIAQPSQETVIDAQNKLVLPGLIDAHTHIDKSFSLSSNLSGDLEGAIAAMLDYKAKRNVSIVKSKAEKAIRLAIKNGVTLLRSHLDLSNESDLATIEAVLELKDQYQQMIDLEFTVLGPTETAQDVALVKRAVDLGIDMIGGAPSLSDKPERSIKNAISLAVENDLGLDLHIDEKQSTEILALEILAKQCIQLKHKRPVIASHCVSLAYLGEEAFDELADLVLEANISIVSLPTCNLTLMGRHTPPVTRGIAPIKKLIKKGIKTAIASDNVQDPFNPFGNYDPLLILNTACMAGHFSAQSELEQAYKLITSHAAHIFDYSGYGLQSGCKASFVITDSTDTYASAVSPPEKLATIKDGHLVYQKNVSESWYA